MLSIEKFDTSSSAEKSSVVDKNSSLLNIYQSFLHYQIPDRKSESLHMNLACWKPLNTWLLGTPSFFWEAVLVSCWARSGKWGWRACSYPSFRLRNPSFSILIHCAIAKMLQEYNFCMHKLARTHLVSHRKCCQNTAVFAVMSLGFYIALVLHISFNQKHCGHSVLDDITTQLCQIKWYLSCHYCLKYA